MRYFKCNDLKPEDRKMIFQDLNLTEEEKAKLEADVLSLEEQKVALKKQLEDGLITNEQYYKKVKLLNSIKS